MKLNRLGAFTLGVIITAASVGTVSFVNAAGDATIKACANKKTGSMRYIAKGKCKKTEKALSWNQMGPQGLPGTSGAAGETGAAGTNSQNFYVVDGEGKTLGRFVLTSINDSYGIMDGNRLWAADPKTFGFYGVPDSITFYSDATCQSPLFPNWVTGSGRLSESLSQQWVGIEHNTFEFPKGTVQRAFVRLDNTKWSKSSFTNIYRGGFGRGCNLTSSDPRSDDYLPEGTTFYKTVEIPMLTYVAPLTIVAK
jgi:hypothetical protein